MLEDEIVSGRWQSGTRLPSEPETARHFGVSRSTVRQALARLEQEGLIARRKGEGTFVDAGRPRSWMLQASEGLFQEELHRAGRRVTSSVLRTEQGRLPPWACESLELPPESAGVSLERVRSVDDRVALYVINYLSAHLADAVADIEADQNGSLYERVAERHGVRVAGAQRRLEAITAGERLAALLEVAPASPLVFIESISWDRDMTPFDCYRAFVRTDRMRIEISVTSATAPTLLGGEEGG